MSFVSLHNYLSPESTGTMTAITESDLGESVRRRVSASESDRNRIGETPELRNGESERKEMEEKEKEKEEIEKFALRPSAPAHRRNKESPLSSASIFKQSHTGIFNLCIVVLVAVNSRLIIENLMKYGLLISSGFWFSSRSLRDWPLLMCCLSLGIFPLGAYLVEKMVRRKSINEKIAVAFHITITTTALLYPVYVILRCDSAVQSGLTLMLFACIVWLKLVSYAHTNYDLRALANSGKGKFLSSMLNEDYLDQVSFKSLAYFMVAPTLCYQLSYPRTASVRKGWVVRQFLKLVVVTGIMGFIIEQYINPIVKNSEHPLKGDILYAVERVLKLSVPNLYVWLCLFYCFFHLWLNILAEILRFGDREFYKDWWNAKTVEELCIAVPCHIFKFWAFIGIMFQVPLVVITKYVHDKFRNSMVGNIIFWCFFSIYGQPMCVLLYYHDVMNRKLSSS